MKPASRAQSPSSTVRRSKAIEVRLPPGDVESDVDVRSSSLSRMLSTLNLFSAKTPSLTVNEIADLLGVPKSTGYRYVQELTKVGLLIRLDRSITLGPRIIELDLSIREGDPVIRAAASLMQSLTDQTGLDVSLAKLYGSAIITVHMERNSGKQLPYGFGRGRPQPLWRGSGSKALVAALPAARLRRIHAELAQSPTGAPTWDLFYDEVQTIRRQGFCRTSGELNEGTTGVSAPIFGRGRLVVASLTANGLDQRFALFNETSIADLVVRTADAIGARLSADTHL